MNFWNKHMKAIIWKNLIGMTKCQSPSPHPTIHFVIHESYCYESLWHMMPRGEYKIVRHRDNFAHHWRVPNTQREREKERERINWTLRLNGLRISSTVWVLVSPCQAARCQEEHRRLLTTIALLSVQEYCSVKWQKTT